MRPIVMIFATIRAMLISFVLYFDLSISRVAAAVSEPTGEAATYLPTRFLLVCVLPSHLQATLDS